MTRKITKHLTFIIVTALIVLILGVLTYRYINRETEGEIIEKVRNVSVITAADFKNNTSIIKVNGTIESLQQIDLRAQLSAELKSLNVSLGSVVTAGQVLASFKNDEVVAGLKVAEADLKTAEQSLASFNGNNDNQIATAKTSLYNTLITAYTTADDVLHSKIDTLFKDPTAYTPQLTVQPNGFGTSDLKHRTENQRKKLQTIMSEWQRVNKTLTPENVNIEIAKTVYDNIFEIKILADQIAEILNNTPTDEENSPLPQQQTMISGVRSGLTTLLQGLTSAQEGMRATADSKTMIEGGIEKAQAQLTVAKTNLERSEIIAPFSGRVSAINFKVGDLVSAGSPVVSINNDSALQVKVYISQQDINKVKIGSPVLIEKEINGTITNIAGAIDPNTKKVEVKVAVENSSKLLIGQSVSIEIPTQKEVEYLAPIQAIKITATDNYVLVIDSNNEVATVTVQIGEVFGDLIEIKSGLNDQMEIISPVYGLEIGQRVTI